MKAAAFPSSSFEDSVSKVMMGGRPPLCTNWDWCSSTDTRHTTVKGEIFNTKVVLRLRLSCNPEGRKNIDLILSFYD